MSHRVLDLSALAAAFLWLTLGTAAAQNANRPAGVTGPGFDRVAAASAALTSPAAALSRAATVRPNGPEKRVALVIGNSTYEAVTPLANPVRDARAIAQLLSGAGFEVISAANLRQEDMRQVIGDFTRKIAERGPDTVAAVFYAGHGLQVEGENFLVPVDARITAEADVSTQAVRLLDLMKALESVPSRMRIVVLDACRNNPFDALGDAGGKGLAMVDAPAGSIVAYSTAPGTEASDGAGQHSPYAAAFIRSVREPGLPIEHFFKRVRKLVHETTDGKQTPWESSSLTGDFTFFAADGSPIAASIPAPQPARVQVSELSSRSVRDAYEVVVQEDSVEYYEEFVRLYPSDPLCERIRRLLARRLQMVAWHKTLQVNSKDAYQSFLKHFPNSDLSGAARRLRERPRLVALPVVPRNPLVKPIPVGPIGPKGPILGRPTGPVVVTPKPAGSATKPTGPVTGKPTGPVIATPNPNGPVVKPTVPVVPKPTGPVTTLPTGTGKPAGPVAGKPGTIVTLPPQGTVGARPGSQTAPVVGKPGRIVTLPPQTRPVITRPPQAGTAIGRPAGRVVAPRVADPVLRRPVAPRIERAPALQRRVLAPQRQTFSAPRQTFSAPRQSFGSQGRFGAARGAFRRR